MSDFFGDGDGPLPAQVVSGATSAVVAFYTTVKTATTTIVSSVTSFVSSLASAVSSLAGSIAGFIGKLAGVLVTGLFAVIGLAVAAFGGLLAAIKTSADAMTKFAKAAASIRAQTGLSYGQSGELLSRFGAFGMSPEDTDGAFGSKDMNPFFAQLRGMLLGLPAFTDPRFNEALAINYQSTANSGPLGRYMANQQLDSYFGGSAPANVRWMANLPIEKVRDQVQWNQKTQSSLGVTPAMIKAFAEDIPLLTARLGNLWEMIKIRFAGQLAPLFQKILSGAADYISKNADKIADAIRRVALWLTIEAPVMVLNFGARVLEVMGIFLLGAGTFLHSLAANTNDILGVLDTIINGFRSFVSVMVGISTAISQVVSNIAAQAQAGTGLPGALGKLGSAITGNPPSSTIPGGGTTTTGPSNAIPGGGPLTTTGPSSAVPGGPSPTSPGSPGNALPAGSKPAPGTPNAPGGGNFLTDIVNTIIGGAVVLTGGRMAASKLLPALPAMLPALANPAVSIPLVGTALGVWGYEKLRENGYLGEDMPSTWEIITKLPQIPATDEDLDNTMFGQSPGERAARAHSKKMAPQRAQIEARRLAKQQTNLNNALQNNPASLLLPQNGRGPLAAYFQGQAASNAMFPESQLQKKYGSTLTSLIEDGAKQFDNGGYALLDYAKGSKGMAEGWKNSEILQALRNIEKSVDKTADNTGGNGVLRAALLNAFRNLPSRIGSYIAEDAALNQMRV